MGGGSKIQGESLSCQLQFRSARTTKNASAQGSLKFRVSNSFWEGTRREKTCLKKFTYLHTCLLSQLVSQNKIIMYFYMWLYCVLSTSFLEVQIMHIDKKGRRFQLCHQFLAVFLLGQDMVMSQMSLYIELDRHS